MCTLASKKRILILGGGFGGVAAARHLERLFRRAEDVEIVLVSRVGAEGGLRRSLEHWFASAARKLGWRTEFAWQRYAAWAARSPDVRLVERRAMPPLGHFSLIRFAKDGARAEQPNMAAAG